MLFITHPYFLVCFFAFSYSLSLSFTTTLFFLLLSLKIEKSQKSIDLFKKMEEPLNILTIGPEQMNKCSGEDTLLALKN